MSARHRGTLRQNPVKQLKQLMPGIPCGMHATISARQRDKNIKIKYIRLRAADSVSLRGSSATLFTIVCDVLQQTA